MPRKRKVPTGKERKHLEKRLNYAGNAMWFSVIVGICLLVWALHKHSFICGAFAALLLFTGLEQSAEVDAMAAALEGKGNASDTGGGVGE